MKRKPPRPEQIKTSILYKQSAFRAALLKRKDFEREKMVLTYSGRAEKLSGAKSGSIAIAKVISV
jgi:hypothetical protein